MIDDTTIICQEIYKEANKLITQALTRTQDEYKLYLMIEENCHRRQPMTAQYLLNDLKLSLSQRDDKICRFIANHIVEIVTAIERVKKTIEGEE